jgi:WD40 repeat protein
LQVTPARDRRRPTSGWVGLALSAAAALASGCLKEKDSLIIVSLTADTDLPTATEVSISAGSTTQSFALTGLRMIDAVRRGIYVDSETTGHVSVRATVQAGPPCTIYQKSDAAVVPSAGSTVEIALRLTAAGNCTTTDAGSDVATGLPQPPSLATCHEYAHAATTDCATDSPSIFSVAISPDGQLVATAGDDARAKIWLFDGRTLTAEGHVLPGGGFGVGAFSPDGTLYAVGWTTGIDIWSVSGWIRQRTLLTDSNVYDLAFTPDGQQIISVDANKLYAHNIGTVAALHSVTIDDGIWAMAVSPAASTTPGVAVATRVGTVKVFTHAATGFVAVGTPLVADGSAAPDKTLSVRFSPDGRLLAAGNTLGVVHLWDYPITSTTPTSPDIDVGTPTASSEVNMIAFSPSGRYLGFAGGVSESVSTWNAAAPRNILASYLNPSSWVLSIAFSPSGTALIAGEYDCGYVLVCAD